MLIKIKNVVTKVIIIFYKFKFLSWKRLVGINRCKTKSRPQLQGRLFCLS